ncbi:MAG: ribonuclease III domain-containing protein [Benniella sp.]|nr:MAG: ribonuclease III domain-containing protein [Benniella sp.]
MPKAPRHHPNQVGSASKRPAYQAITRSRRAAPAPAPAITSGPAPGTVSGPAAAASSGPTSSSASGPPATISGPAPATVSSAAPVPVPATVSSASASAPVPAPASSASAPASSASASAPLPASAPVPAPAPAPTLVLAPAASPARRLLAAEDTDLTHTFGSRVLKMFLGIDAFTSLLGSGAGPLTTKRMNETASIVNLRTMNKSIGCGYLCLGADLSLWEFAFVHDLRGHTSFGQYLHDYRSSLTAADVDLGPGTPEIQEVEAIIGYPFRDKRLLEEALTLPGGVGRDYERLEFLGDSVLDVVAATAWIDEGAPLNQICARTEVTTSNATLTVAGLEAGLDAYMRNCPQSKRHEIKLKRISLATRWEDNKVYWERKDKVKALADVVEAVLGAVFLDSGMQLLDVENVFRRILWPVVERRLA